MNQRDQDSITGKGKVVALCGMPGSGKGEFAEIARSLNIPVYSMGDVVRDYFKEYFPNRDPAEIGGFADEERKERGDGIWARRLIEKIQREGGDELVIIDGLRSRHESDLFSDEWGDRFIVCAIHSSPNTRFKRLRDRGRGDDPKTRYQFNNRDIRELGWGLGDVIALADIMVLNEGTVKEIRGKAKEMTELLRWTR